jgi:arginase
VPVILVPYHLDEHRPGLDCPLEPDVVTTAALPAGDVWERLGTLYPNVAAQVAATAAAGGRPVVMSGDCPVLDAALAGWR